MDFSEYTKLLIKTALADWIVVFIIALIILIDEIVYVNSKKECLRKKEMNIRQTMI